jgi:hypothetical protein
VCSSFVEAAAGPKIYVSTRAECQENVQATASDTLALYSVHCVFMDVEKWRKDKIL